LRGEFICKEKELIVGLLKESRILKKGIRIQNKRIEDLFQKDQELEELRRFAAQQKRELNELKQQNIRLQQEQARRQSYQPNNQFAMGSYRRDNFDHENDDHMVQ
jgi:hypothetical protein